MPTTHVLYLHGFRSSPQSLKAQITAQTVAKHHPNVAWLCPALSPSPTQAMQDTLQAVDSWPKHSMAVVGSSLGGFYATWLAEKWGCKAALLNPAVFPARDLANHIGHQTHWHDPSQDFYFDATYVRELANLEISAITRPERYFAVIAKGDEVLDWREMHAHYPGAHITLLPASDHGLSDFDQHLGPMLDFLNLA